MKYTFLTILAALIVLAGCKRNSPAPSPEEQQAILADAPELFSAGDNGVAMQGIESLHLGQGRDQALAELDNLCPKTMEYRAGDMGKGAWFRGCVLPEPRGPIVSVRVGFWPRLGDRVATLEIKRTDTDLKEVRERFRQLTGDPQVDLVRPGLLEMRTDKHQLLADIDDGADGPIHITVGYSPRWADKQESR